MPETITPTERDREEAREIADRLINIYVERAAYGAPKQGRQNAASELAQALAARDAVARREGAEDMRERCAKAAEPEEKEAPCGCLDPTNNGLNYGCDCLDPDDAAREGAYWRQKALAAAIRSLPLTEKDER